MMYRRDSPAAGSNRRSPGLDRDHHVVASADEGAAEVLLCGFALSG
jgi:hypothetical protein